MTRDSASDGGRRVLGIDVAQAELMQWLGWAMPMEQPYVMAAAGVEGAEHVWMQREPIEAWLAEKTVMLPARSTDDSVGIVYVWRRPDGLIDHTALALGQGYALHKPSDGWMSPTKVLTTRELMASARVPGRRLRRHRLS